MNILDIDNPYWESYFFSPLVYALRNASRASGADPAKFNENKSSVKSDQQNASKKTEKSSSDAKRLDSWRDELFNAEHPYRDNYNVSVKRDANNAVTSYKIYTVYAPYKKSEVEVQVESDKIVINIGTRETKENEDSSEEVVFMRYARSPRNFSIPFKNIVRDTNEEVDADNISASTNDGVLEITVPIIRKTISRKVPLA